MFLTKSCQASLILVKTDTVTVTWSASQKFPYWSTILGSPLKASMELPFRDSVWHHQLFSFHLHDILDSSSLYLDFHVWEQDDLRKKVADLRGPMLQVLAHKSRFCFRSSFSRRGINFAAVCLIYLRLQCISTCHMLGLQCYKHCYSYTICPRG